MVYCRGTPNEGNNGSLNSTTNCRGWDCPLRLSLPEYPLDRISSPYGLQRLRIRPFSRGTADLVFLNLVLLDRRLHVFLVVLTCKLIAYWLVESPIEGVKGSSLDSFDCVGTTYPAAPYGVLLRLILAVSAPVIAALCIQGSSMHS